MNLKKRVVFNVFLAVTFLLSMLVFPGISTVVADESFADNFLIVSGDENLLIYQELKEGGVIHQYEEEVKSTKGKTTIHTKIYDMSSGKKKLIDNYKTNITYSDDKAIIQQEGANDLHIILSDYREYSRENIKDEEFSLLTTEDQGWTIAGGAVTHIGYLVDYDANKGHAVYNTERTNHLGVSRGKEFDDFRDAVNTMKSRETSILRDATGAALFALIADIVTGKTKFSWAILSELARKASIPVTLAWNGYNWYGEFTTAKARFYNIPGDKNRLPWCPSVCLM